MGNSSSNGFSNSSNNRNLLKKDGKQAYGSCRTGSIHEMQIDDETSNEEDNCRRRLLESELSPLIRPATNIEQTINECDYDADSFKNDGDGGSYYSLLKNNPAFRLYYSSLLVTNFGEWLTYIASIDLIENKLTSLGAESRTAISILVLVRLLPNLFCCSLGGILADKYDRRKLMYGLDIASAWSSVLFVFAYE